MRSRLEAVGVKEDPDGPGSDPWNHHKVSLWLGQANSARRQDNFVVALKQIRKAHKVWISELVRNQVASSLDVLQPVTPSTA